MGFASKFLRSHAWKRFFFEKAIEPLHVNALALGVWLFGNFRARVTFDLVLREYHAFCLLKAADLARSHGIKEITAVEFGVAQGFGLMNLNTIGKQVTAATGVKIKVVGFDTGTGMPKPVDFRDHPDLYQAGDFPMDEERLRKALPPEVELVIGPLNQTLSKWKGDKLVKCPIGYIVIDVDYFSSTVDALSLLDGTPESYLPFVTMYFDDIMFDEHNDACGELLAIKEFNASHPKRPIQRPEFISSRRVYKNAPWLKHIFYCHILEHSVRSISQSRSTPLILDNPYIR